MPTSRATRVTSEVNTVICWIIVLTIEAERRNSPSSGRPATSSCIFCERSPLATAAIVRVTSVVGQSRSSTSVLKERSISAQAPPRPPMAMRWRVLPSRPTTWPLRSSSRQSSWFELTISLKVSAILPAKPSWSPGRRTEKSPSRMACSARSSSRWLSRGICGRASGACGPPDLLWIAHEPLVTRRQVFADYCYEERGMDVGECLHSGRGRSRSPFFRTAIRPGASRVFRADDTWRCGKTRAPPPPPARCRRSA